MLSPPRNEVDNDSSSSHRMTSYRSNDYPQNEYINATPTGSRRRVASLPVQAENANSTLLPTTYSPHARTSEYALHLLSSNNNTCNNFLLGGTYYPGKDKQRRHVQRKTYWYRIFCSSWWRKGLTAIASTYLLFFFILRPFSTTILDYGNLLASGRRRNGLHATWLLYDQSLLGNIQNIEEERAAAIRLSEERQRLQYGPEGRHIARLKVIERIVPGWYHRNDENVENNNLIRKKLKQVEQAANPKHEPNPNSNENGDNPPPDRLRENKVPIDENKSNRNVDVRSKSKKHNNESNVAILRTLRNMHLFRNMTSCPSILPATDIQTTIVLQSTQDRLWTLKETCERWKDPIILVLFLLPDETFDASDVVPTISCPQLTIIPHIMDAGLENGGELYPVNRLRNIGLDAVRTSHVIVMDIDFVPSQDLHALIHSVLAGRNLFRQEKSNASNILPPGDREAIIVPAFERVPPREFCGDDQECVSKAQRNLKGLVLPRSFGELHSCILERRECRVFQSNNNLDGHSSTRSESWLNKEWYDGELPDEHNNSAYPQRIKTLRCFDSFRYEPYVVLRWCPADNSKSQGPPAPYYDERFHGYGKNKIELISHLRLMGYRFSILPEGFVIHAPHSVSNAKKAWESTKDFRLHADMDQLYPKFLRELTGMYKQKHHNIVKQC